MTENILSHFYRIQVPLPNNPLKALNSYVIKSKDRNLIIDTGFNRPECKEAMYAGLEELGIDLGKTDLFITHVHADHSGLAATLATQNSRVYCSQVDSLIINDSCSESHWVNHGRHFQSYGFPLDNLKNAINKHPAHKYCIEFELDFTLVGEGDPITIGDYHFTVIETPGHTPGHLSLYEPDKKLLISGDHLLDDITPNITIWSGVPDSLGRYLQSLDKINRLDVDLVLPAHRKLIHDHKKRIEELQAHHQHRLNEVLSILESGESDAYQTAARMTWDLTYSSWQQFPIPQKWFATGEAAAHLEHLAANNLIQKQYKNGKFVFSRLK